LKLILQENIISVFLLVTCHFFVIVCEINLTNLKKQHIYMYTSRLNQIKIHIRTCSWS